MTLHSQAQELKKLLYSLSDLFHLQEQEQLCCYDVTTSECRTLSYLKHDSERNVTVTMNELADKLHLTRGGATRVIDKLSNKGYVIRQTHPGDKRVCCIVLTPQGTELIDRIETEVVERHKQILTQLDPTMRQVVLASLQALQNSVQQVHRDGGE
ncbi:MarR family winged helix-turn-helix transcriptional regulator [Bacillus sp. JCM 19034]|uniref:MarR family winged helix-turn-helix transcriptional regulator n=1 Tax=Bacillus sp. JCM 19034 TaxID=1481928 RepID=UPI0007850453|nr:MarR family transcriptional regulator [Bacillus sp. JCM 19034]